MMKDEESNNPETFVSNDETGGGGDGGVEQSLLEQDSDEVGYDGDTIENNQVEGEEDADADDDDEDFLRGSVHSTKLSDGGMIVHATVPVKRSRGIVAYYKHMSRNPWLHLVAAFCLAFALSAIGLIAGEFSVTVDNAGWQSRGTTISDRHAQVLMVSENLNELFYDQDGSVWDDLQTNVQPGWDTDDDEDRRRRRQRRLATAASSKAVGHQHQRQLSKFENVDQCDTSWYSRVHPNTMALYAVWKTSHGDLSALDSDVLLDICKAEENTLTSLENNGLCFGCPFDKCLPPYSLVLLVRNRLSNGFSLSCQELASEWANDPQLQNEVTQELATCADNMRSLYDPAEGGWINITGCPADFSPVLVDEAFGENNMVIHYTTSIFPTWRRDIDDLYDIVDTFDRAGGNFVLGAYEAGSEGFLELYAQDVLVTDMSLAMASAFVTMCAILLHTRSPWLTLIGFFQIAFSFPLAYFVYYFIGRLEFFPFLNFIGVFVVFALGADDVFVAVDKWKNARLELGKEATTEEIAILALPDAAMAMFLTTLTTAIAFFATAICPVAPIKCFAVFCGLLILFDYFMNLFLVFPALCLYDKWLQAGRSNCCIVCNCCCFLCRKKKDDEEKNNTARTTTEYGEGAEKEKEQESLIRRILTAYYVVIHRFRWLFLVACAAGLVLAAIFSTTLTLPDSSDVRVLNEDVEYEQNYAWRQRLLSTVLLKSGGSEVYVIWGVRPADTGDLTNPDSWTTLELDYSFNPRTEESQRYLVEFCDRYFATDFADKTFTDYKCPINAFDEWLKEESTSESPSSEYTENCNGVTSVPVPEQDFDPCIIAWSQMVPEKAILQKRGEVKIMVILSQSIARFDSPYDVLDDEWHKHEDWLSRERSLAPPGVNGVYHSSEDFWWYDTNGQMLRTAYTGAAIAISCAAVVVFLSSKSLVVTLFAIFSIGYVLTATTSCLVALGWELGFLESICFAILIGISCDFVIHFGHAYTIHHGSHSRHFRAKHAIISMGPSILAAAGTTLAAAIIMLFTEITFFQKFAVILFLTIVHATLGSFVLFIVMADCVGPKEPTKLWDQCTAKYCKKKQEVEGEQSSTSGVSTEDAVEKTEKEQDKDVVATNEDR